MYIAWRLKIGIIQIYNLTGIYMIEILYSKKINLLLILFIMLSFNMDAQTSNKNTELVTVNYVDLNKYIGTWYEIAKIPNSFQNKCTRNTTATYILRNDGNIDVINKCIEADGSLDEAKGIAKITDKKSNSKLEVSFVRIFGISLFWGDYWIIGLDKDYRYAVVGTPSRKYGWILSRTPQLAKNDLEEIYNILKQQGYNINDFKMDVQ